MIKEMPANQAKRQKTELVLVNICNLPPIPKVTKEALDLLNNDNTPINTLSKVVSRDQGLVTKILTIANSPMYGLQRRVTTIDFAILVLGFKELKNIITVLSLMESFINKTDKYLNQKEFWLHSYLTGTASKRLAEEFDYPNSGEAFIAGFLHDMGITLMHRYFHTSFISINDMLLKRNFSLHEAELNTLGMTHQDIGFFLVKKWNFPMPLCEAILYHHKPSAAEQNKVLSSIIHLADYMTVKLDLGSSYWDRNMKFDENVINILNLSDEPSLDNFINDHVEIFKSQLESATIF
jgi:HD-like signal output (HDOD) protein